MLSCSGFKSDNNIHISTLQYGIFETYIKRTESTMQILSGKMEQNQLNMVRHLSNSYTQQGEKKHICP